MKNQVISQSMMLWNKTDRKSLNLNTEFNAAFDLDQQKAIPERSTIGFIFYAVPSDSELTMSGIDGIAGE